MTLKSGPHLQIVTDDGTRPLTRNAAPGAEAAAAIDELLAEPFGNWHVETTTAPCSYASPRRATPRSTAPPPAPTRGPRRQHDRAKQAPARPRRPAVQRDRRHRREAPAGRRVPAGAGRDPADPAAAAPLRVVDLGCGNAYLTFAAYRYLAGRGLDVHVVGVDVREDQRARNTALADAARLRRRGVVRGRHDRRRGGRRRPDLVLALHACDTATDDALARAIGWGAGWMLAAPCCHHDIAAQLKGGPAPAPYGQMTRHGILRERFADVLTDALRAALLRLHGYRVDVVEFVDSEHTPRNLLLRARRTGTGDPGAGAEYAGADRAVGCDAARWSGCFTAPTDGPTPSDLDPAGDLAVEEHPVVAGVRRRQPELGLAVDQLLPACTSGIGHQVALAQRRPADRPHAMYGCSASC